MVEQWIENPRVSSSNLDPGTKRTNKAQKLSYTELKYFISQEKYIDRICKDYLVPVFFVPANELISLIYQNIKYTYIYNK